MNSTHDTKNKIKKTEDHERAARAFASAASALDSVLASVAASHPADRLSALRGEESTLLRELETKRELVQGVAAKIDGWRRRAKEALEKAEAVAGAAAGAARGEELGKGQPPETAAAAAAPVGQQA